MNEAGEATTAQDYLRQLFRQNVTGAFSGTTAAEFTTWKSDLLAYVRKLFAHYDPGFEDVEPVDVRTISETKLESCTRREITFTNPTYGTVVPATILFPPPGTENGAGVVAQHGHGNFGRLPVIGDRSTPGLREEIARHDYDFGLGLAQEGYHVIAADLFGFGQRSEPRAAFSRQTSRDPCDLFEVFLQIAGRNMVTLQVNDTRRAVTILQQLPGVDPGRVGMAGLSQGGRMTMYTGVADDRLKVLVASGACNTFRDRVALMSGACGAQVLPGLFPRADTPELFGATAPRALQLQWGRKDPLIVAEYTEPGLERVRRCFRAAGTEERLSVHTFDGAHVFDLDAAAAWMGIHL